MAVYTEVSDEALIGFLKNYNIGGLRQKTPIAEGVENTNYRIDTDKGRFILTLFEKRVRESDLPFFVALTAHLADKGTPVPAPLADKRGVVVHSLCERPAVIIEFLAGRPTETINTKACAAIGRVLADLHGGVADFRLSRPNPLSVEGWKTLAANCAEADRIEPGLRNFVQSELEFLEGAWPRDLPVGVVHTDLFPDNVLFEDGNVVGVIDFYFACSDFFAFDLAVTVNAWCFDSAGAIDLDCAKAMIAAYKAERPLSRQEKDAMPVLLRGAALRFLLTRAYDWLNQKEGALVKVKDPLAYKTILAFHQQRNSAAKLGF